MKAPLLFTSLLFLACQEGKPVAPVDSYCRDRWEEICGTTDSIIATVRTTSCLMSGACPGKYPDLKPDFGPPGGSP